MILAHRALFGPLDLNTVKDPPSRARVQDSHACKHMCNSNGQVFEQFKPRAVAIVKMPSTDKTTAACKARQKSANSKLKAESVEPSCHEKRPAKKTDKDKDKPMKKQSCEMETAQPAEIRRSSRRKEKSQDLVRIRTVTNSLVLPFPLSSAPLTIHSLFFFFSSLRFPSLQL